MPARAVTVIPPTINPATRMPVAAVLKRRVAGYARVSTANEEQATSYEAQVDYYTRYIQQNPEWEFVSVYTDEGISGLNTKKREGFNRMVADALAGRIDLIITKSVSRFARNTVDSLTTIRKLKEHGVEVYFEEQNIWTFDSKGELLITIMSSLAQEESRSISENVTWGQRKRFADGKLSLGYKNFLGYGKGPDKDHPLVIIEEQAEIVRRIYRMLIEGKTPFAIAKTLTAEGIPTPGGKKNWGAAVIESILTNEKYKGSALLQKSFTIDFLQKKMKQNEGEVPQYLIQHSHEAIIQPQEWELVQIELKRRKSLGQRYSGGSVFGSRIVCGDCGSFYGPKVWNSTDKYRRRIWQCNGKFKGERRCATPHLTEEDIKARFLAAYNALLPDRDAILDDCRTMLEALTDCTAIDAELAELLREAEAITELTRRCIEENAVHAQSQEEYAERYHGYEERYEAVKRKVERLQEQRVERQEESDRISAFMFELHESNGPLTEFDNKLWLAIVDTVTVGADGKLVFRFRNGRKVVG